MRQLRPLIGLYRKYCVADINEMFHVLGEMCKGKLSHLDMHLALAEFPPGYQTNALAELENFFPLYKKALQ